MEIISFAVSIIGTICSIVGLWQTFRTAKGTQRAYYNPPRSPNPCHASDVEDESPSLGPGRYSEIVQRMSLYDAFAFRFQLVLGGILLIGCGALMAFFTDRPEDLFVTLFVITIVVVVVVFRAARIVLLVPLKFVLRARLKAFVRRQRLDFEELERLLALVDTMAWRKPETKKELQRALTPLLAR